MSRRATWLASVLRLAGCEVVERQGWEARGATDRSGKPLPFVDLRSVVWHHDASPVGPSPGLPAYMAGQIDRNKAGANCWVDMFGRWHLVAAGVTYHAGNVLHGKPGNQQSIGVETDHTTGERWPSEQLAALRIGTAAILKHLGQPATALEFHRTICEPIGRKSDPDGLNLLDERIAVAHHMLRGEAPPAPLPPMPAPTTTNYPEATVLRIDMKIDTDKDGRGYRDIDVPPMEVVSVISNTANPPTAGYKPIPDVARLDVGGKTRVVVEEAVPNGRIDVTLWVA